MYLCHQFFGKKKQQMALVVCHSVFVPFLFSNNNNIKQMKLYSDGSQPYLGGNTHFEIEKLATHL
jgi:hypothetical protein